MIKSFLLAMSLLLVACGSEHTTQHATAEATNCDAAEQECLVEVDEHVISLRLQPGVAALKPFALNVEIENASGIDEVIVDFQMVGMEMGPNRYRLLAADSGWQGRATLPVCTTSRTDWLAVVEFSDNGKLYHIEFPFTSR